MTTETPNTNEEQALGCEASELSGLVMRANVGDAADYLHEYWRTYKIMQPGYNEYTNKTVIEDALYGLAAAINPDYRFANGFSQFKRDLAEYLNA